MTTQNNPNPAAKARSRQHISYLVAYSGGNDFKPSTQRTVTRSCFVWKIETVAYGLTFGSTRAFKICVKYCDWEGAGFSRMTKKVQTAKTASDDAPVQSKRRMVHQRSPTAPARCDVGSFLSAAIPPRS